MQVNKGKEVIWIPYEWITSMNPGGLFIYMDLF